MANNRNVLQQVTNVSVNKRKLLEVATDYDFNKTELRVFLCLLTELNGWSPPSKGSSDTTDPKNFRMIDKENIANLLGIKKKDVKLVMEKFEDMYLIEKGDSDTAKNGYRFTF